MDSEQKIAALLSDLSRLERQLGENLVAAQELRADLEKLTKKREYKAVEIPPWRFPPKVKA